MPPRSVTASGKALSVLLLCGLLQAACSSQSSERSVEPQLTEGKSDRSPEVVRRLADDRIVESSGLVLSTRQPSILLTHNDSGDRARIFAVGRGGGTRAVWRLSGVKADDWEDLATGRHHMLWVGDIGDNSEVREAIAVYRFQEPERLTSRAVDSRRFRLSYPDGSHDAETLLVHPRTGRMYVVTKEQGNAAIYRAPRRLRGGGVNVLTRLRGAPDLITAGDFSHSGRRIVLRSYGRAFLFRGVREAGTTRELPPAPQAESITWARHDAALLTGSEGVSSRVWRVPLG